MPADPVIVATGGARGLTARLVNELLTDGAPRRVWLLGTGPAPDLTTPVRLPPKPEAIRDLMSRHPGEKPAALNRRYEAAVREADRVRTILDLERVCGPDRVRYRQCDVRDADAVASVIGEVLGTDGRVDVVVHGAGLVRSTALVRKDLDDYRLVRDVKVRGDHNLRTALAGHIPGLWCGISSVGAFIGMRGEADYEAGNEYLLLAAAGARAAGRDEVALVSGLWVESGMAAGYTVGTPFTTGLADFTQLTDEQGVEFFRAELAGRGGPGLATAWLGEAEWSTLHRAAPGLRAACEELAGSADAPVFLVAPERVGDEASWRFDIGLDQHPWLLDHLVDDRPTVPATVMLEIAAEAAMWLAPGLVPVRMTDVVLSRFFRAPRSRWPRPIAVSASRTGDSVHVVISSPPAGPVSAQEHARVTVRLAESPRSGQGEPVSRPPGMDVPDVYQLGGVVALSGVFANLCDARLHDDGGSAQVHFPPIGDPLGRFAIPSVLLDSALRAVVFDGRRPGELPLVIPTALAAVDLFTAGNDATLVARWGEGITVRHWSDPNGTDSHCAAIAADGTVLLRITGITTSTRDVFDTRTHRWNASAPLSGATTNMRRI
ncbi:MAG TPA: SDR family oxidoreductase [Actinokineospora sp.]|nr:SDR family oxidoreductase [Actinokineospora sp.]